MTDPLETVAFLVGSSNRLAVLEALRDGPRSADALAPAVAASRVTLWRVLRDLRDRGLIRHDDEVYALTNEGRVVTDALTALLDTVEAVATLDDLVEYLPLDDLGFDVRRLDDADVVVPSPSDPQAPIRFAERQVRDAREIRILTHGMAPGVIETLYERHRPEGWPVEAVVTADVIRAIAIDPETSAQFDGLLAADTVDFFRYDGEIPHVMAVLDDERVGMGVDDDGTPRGVIETDDGAVLDWARRTIDDYRVKAVRMTPDDFTA